MGKQTIEIEERTYTNGLQICSSVDISCWAPLNSSGDSRAGTKVQE